MIPCQPEARCVADDRSKLVDLFAEGSLERLNACQSYRYGCLAVLSQSSMRGRAGWPGSARRDSLQAVIMDTLTSVWSIPKHFVGTERVHAEICRGLCDS